LTRRADELAELADAVPCAGGPVQVLAELPLTGLRLAAHAQLRLARPLAEDPRLPWQRSALGKNTGNRKPKRPRPARQVR